MTDKFNYRDYYLYKYHKYKQKYMKLIRGGASPFVYYRTVKDDFIIDNKTYKLSQSIDACLIIYENKEDSSDKIVIKKGQGKERSIFHDAYIINILGDQCGLIGAKIGIREGSDQSLVTALLQLENWPITETIKRNWEDLIYVRPADSRLIIKGLLPPPPYPRIIMDYMDGDIDKLPLSLLQVCDLCLYLLETCECLFDKSLAYIDMKKQNVLYKINNGIKFTLGDLGGIVPFKADTLRYLTFPTYLRKTNEGKEGDFIVLDDNPTLHDVFYGIGVVLLTTRYTDKDFLITLSKYKALYVLNNNKSAMISDLNDKIEHIKSDEEQLNNILEMFRDLAYGLIVINKDSPKNLTKPLFLYTKEDQDFVTSEFEMIINKVKAIQLKCFTKPYQWTLS